MKLKTHRGAAKRFKLTGKGKIVRAKASKSHLLTVKNKKRKRRLRKSALVNTAQAGNIRRLLPHH